MTLLAVLLGAAGRCWASSSRGPLVRLLAPGFEQVPGKAEITVLLTRIMLPFLPLVSFAAVAMGMLNAHERFGTPALAPAVFNVVAIAWAAGLWALGFGPAQVAMGWAVGTLLGGAAQFLIQVPAADARGLALPPGVGAGRSRHPRHRAPDGAGHRGPGRRAGEHLRQHDLRLARAGGRVLAAVRLPHPLPADRHLRRRGGHGGDHAASRTAPPPRDLDGMRGTLRASRCACWPSSPCPPPPGLMVLAVPIVRLLFERGRFGASDTEHTAAALALYRRRPRRLHGGQGAGPGLLRAGHARACRCWPARARWPRTWCSSLACHRSARLPRDRAGHGAGLGGERLSCSWPRSSARVGGLLAGGLPRERACGWSLAAAADGRP